MADVYTELRELIAAECHSQWAGWMKYLFSKTEKLTIDTAPSYRTLDVHDYKLVELIPTESVERWRRQMEAAYDQLPEKERESDRVEADKIIAILNQKGYISIPKP